MSYSIIGKAKNGSIIEIQLLADDWSGTLEYYEEEMTWGTVRKF